MQAIRVENPGSGPGYALALRETDTPAPRAGEVLIRVAGAGVNHADLLQARGKYPPPPGASPILGMEVSGTVIAAGAGVTRIKTGDAVCALLTGGGYADHAVAAQDCLLPAPAGMPLADASALPEAAFTAWTNIMDAGRLAPGETLLVHGGGSGVGSMAIQIFSALGHRVFTTASAAKCARCLELGAARAIDYRAGDFVAAVRDETGGKGVDVILDMVGGDYIQRNMAASAPWGRIVNIAYQNGFKAEIDFTPLLAKRLTLAATTLRGRTLAEKAAIRDTLATRVWPLIAAGRVRPVIDCRLSLAEAAAAHARMRESGHFGKILLIP